MVEKFQFEISIFANSAQSSCKVSLRRKFFLFAINSKLHQKWNSKNLFFFKLAVRYFSYMTFVDVRPMSHALSNVNNNIEFLKVSSFSGTVEGDTNF